MVSRVLSMQIKWRKVPRKCTGRCPDLHFESNSDQDVLPIWREEGMGDGSTKGDTVKNRAFPEMGQDSFSICSSVYVLADTAPRSNHPRLSIAEDFHQVKALYKRYSSYSQMATSSICCCTSEI